jgi:tetratricopeptide (TPR) repeat protein
MKYKLIIGGFVCFVLCAFLIIGQNHKTHSKRIPNRIAKHNSEITKEMPSKPQNYHYTYYYNSKFDEINQLIGKYSHEQQSLPKLEGSNYEAIFSYGKENLESGNFENFIQICHDLINIYPDDSELYLNLTNFFNENGYPEIALEILQKGVEKNPEDKEFALLLGDLLSFQGDHVNALTQYFNLISIDPADPNGFYKLSEIYEALGMIDESDYYLKQFELKTSALTYETK